MGARARVGEITAPFIETVDGRSSHRSVPADVPDVPDAVVIDSLSPSTASHVAMHCRSAVTHYRIVH